MFAEPFQSDSPSRPAAERAGVPVAVIAGGVFVLVVIALFYWLAHRPPAPPMAPPSEEALAYLPQVTVSEFHLSAADNMVGSVIVYLDGKVNNNGDRTVRRLRVRLYFYDTMNQPVLWQERDIIGPGSPPLRPGERREFQLRFDRPPASWNVQPPQFQLVSLEIE